VRGDFVSLMVHVYTIGYMADDPGYQRFFSYISLFTFSMMMLVMANNFLQLLRLGSGGAGVVPADRLLVHASHGHLREPEGLPGEPRRRLRLPAGVGFVFAVFGTLDYGPCSRRQNASCGHRRAHSRMSWFAHLHHLHLPLHRRHGQERAVSAARVAADSMEGPTPSRP